MTRERVRDREKNSRDSDIELISNGGSLDDTERARNTVMQRFRRGESVIQPPDDRAEELGEAIRAEIRKRR
jgi:hypothetical protein